MRRKIEVLILEDELHASRNLAAQLQKYCPDVNVMAEINNVDDAFIWVQKTNLN
jgi:hypothetical protein